jgi:uncharacterized membrane protein
MFKLGYQAFIMYSVMSAYVIVDAIRSIRTQLSSKIFLLLLLPQLFLVSIYPIFSVRSYFGNLERYEGIWGLQWLASEYPDNYAAIQWLNIRDRALSPLPVIVEADGDSYTDYDQVSAFTGSPTVIGWAVHEWLWRGTYDVVSPRRQDVEKIYDSESLSETKSILETYGVRYIIVGTLERQKYPKLQEQKFGFLGLKVFQHGGTEIYEVGKK